MNETVNDLLLQKNKKTTFVSGTVGDAVVVVIIVGSDVAPGGTSVVTGGVPVAGAPVILAVIFII